MNDKPGTSSQNPGVLTYGLIYKELERLLYKHKAMSADRRVEFSVNRAIELTRNMYEIRYTLPDSRREKAIYLKMDSDQQLLSDIIVNQ